jgi:Transposase DDE domain
MQWRMTAIFRAMATLATATSLIRSSRSTSKQAKAVLQTETLEAVADRGYFSSPEILECHEAGIVVTLPKPLTSGAKSEGRFGKQDFAYLPEEDVYRCPAGERLSYRYTNEEAGKMLRRYLTTACLDCSLKPRCTTGRERRITRWEHEHLLDAVQQRLDANQQAMRQRRETVEHPFGTIKARMGATHFLTKRCRRWRRKWRSQSSLTI